VTRRISHARSYCNERFTCSVTFYSSYSFLSLPLDHPEQLLSHPQDEDIHCKNLSQFEDHD